MCEVRRTKGLPSQDSWDGLEEELAPIDGDCDDIEDDRKNNFNKKKYIYLKP